MKPGGSGSNHPANSRTCFAPQRAATRKVHPGFDFTYLKPVNKNFGFTISAGTSTNYLNQDFIQNTWRGASAETNGTTFPHTTPDRPYLSSTAVRDNTVTVQQALAMWNNVFIARHAGHFAARRVGQFRLVLVFVLGDQHVGKRHPACFDRYHQLALAGNGRGQVFDPQRVDGAEFSVQGSAHGVDPVGTAAISPMCLNGRAILAGLPEAVVRGRRRDWLDWAQVGVPCLKRLP